MKIRLSIRTVTVILAVALALPVMAFNRDKPGSSKFYGEQSQQQVADQQAMQGKFGEVGNVDQVSSDDSVDGTVNGKQGSSSFGTADEASAMASLGKATNVAHDHKGSFPWLTLCLLCGFGVLGAVVFKSYSDKVPLPDSLKPQQ